MLSSRFLQSGYYMAIVIKRKGYCCVSPVTMDSPLHIKMPTSSDMNGHKFS